MATTVYFVKACPEASTSCTETLIPSNYAIQGRVYLLNAEPGEYRPVAADYPTAVYYGIGTSHGVNVTYLPDALARTATVQVQPGRLADADTTVSGALIQSRRHWGVAALRAEEAYVNTLDPQVMA